MKKIIIRVLLIAIVLGGAWWGYAFVKQMPKAQQEIATTRVRRGDVIVRSYARGELRATRSVTLTAPKRPTAQEACQSERSRTGPS